MKLPYLERGGEIAMAPPYVAEGVQFFGFVVPISRAVAQARLCDRFLNEPCGQPGRFVPAVAQSLFVFNSIDTLRAEGADADRGGSTEQEFAIWLLVKDTIEDRVLWFHPYMIVDIDTALASGREIYGFPKSLGWFDLSRGPEAPGHLTVETMLVDKFGPQAKRVRQPLVMVNQAPADLADLAALGADEGGFSSTQDLVRRTLAALEDDEPDLMTEATVGAQLLAGSVPMIFLKQIRDAVEPGVACFRSVQVVDARATKYHSARVFARRYHIDVRDADSHPIRADLGLPAGPITPLVAFWTSFDFHIGLCRELSIGPESTIVLPDQSGDEEGGASGPDPAPAPGPSPPPAVAKRRIAILGGGMASLTTAVELTSEPNWQERYEITVYQMGWRLGGKGASGRDEVGRIEEHGLHVWLGFYDNAFRVMKDVYRDVHARSDDSTPTPDERGLCDGMFASWDRAWRPSSRVGVHRQLPDGSFVPRIFTFPTNGDEPGGSEPPDLIHHLCALADWLVDEALTGRHGIYDREEPSEHGGLADFVSGLWDEFTDGVEILANKAGLDAVRAMARLLRQLCNNQFSETTARRILDLGGIFRGWILHQAARFADEPDTLEQLMLIDMGFAITTGLLSDCVIGGQRLSDLRIDFKDWLRSHEAGPRTVSLRTNPFLRGLYDFVFAFEDGEIDDLDRRATFEAGSALRTVLRMLLTYRGAIFWKMQAGMGDTVFTPLYRLLARRGVRFEFFHRVTNLGLSPDGRFVDRIEIERQAEIDPETNPNGYQPLVKIDGLDCWPNKPRTDQLLPGYAVAPESFWDNTSTGKRRLERGRKDRDGFDEVVLGIPVASLPHICPELIAANRAWQDMVKNVKTVRTMAAQIWYRPGITDRGEVKGGAAATGMDEPMDTWADMSELIDREGWLADKPDTLVYFCGPLAGGNEDPKDPKAPTEALALVDQAIAERLWPCFSRIMPGAFKNGLPDPALHRAFYRRANVNPTDRYVLSAAGSSAFRLRADASGFFNLVLAGDWTDNGFNAGCIEAAVISGIRAANAIAGRGIDTRVLGTSLF